MAIDNNAKTPPMSFRALHPSAETKDPEIKETKVQALCRIEGEIADLVVDLYVLEQGYLPTRYEDQRINRVALATETQRRLNNLRGQQKMLTCQHPDFHWSCANCQNFDSVYGSGGPGHQCQMACLECGHVVVRPCLSAEPIGNKERLAEYEGHRACQKRSLVVQSWRLDGKGQPEPVRICLGCKRELKSLWGLTGKSLPIQIVRGQILTAVLEPYARVLNELCLL